MKNTINWKLFWILTIVCTIASLAVIPFQFALIAESTDIPVSWWMLYLGTGVQSAILFSIVTFLGLLLASKVGFTLPVLEGENKRDALKMILTPSILWGLACGAAISILNFAFGDLANTLLQIYTQTQVWQGVLAIFYGGIAEEVLMRLFLVSLFAWILIKCRVSKNASIWIAIVISAVLFGLGHLPITAQMVEITPIVVIRAVVLNGIGGLVFGWLYWKKGLESAMISHFVATGILNVILPFAAGWFM